MAIATTTTTAPTTAMHPVAVRSRHFDAWATLARRRLALSTRTPREIFIPLLTPVLFALVIAPALSDTVGRFQGGLDYMSFVAIATVGLLVPISCMFAGLGVIIDRRGGGLRDLLAAPVARPLIVFGNLAVAVLLAGLQLVVLVVAAVLRGAEFHAGATGIAWFVAASLGLAVTMYGAAEALANVMPTQEEYIGAVPAVAIVPWFFAGSLFPISALPAGLGFFARLLPLTHALALMRYGLLDRNAAGLRDIWGMSNPTAMAALSMVVVTLFALCLTALGLRAFRRASLH
jgi:ABC-type polysaccharide/polyol phosphate export permease